MQEEEDLISKLKAISDENRFRLLTELKEPRTINEIQLTAETGSESYRGERNLTRQGIQYHLDILRESGFAKANLENRQGRRMNVHRVDPGGLFLFHDQIQRLTADLGRNQPATERPTCKIERSKDHKWPSEPRLVVTHGIHPGRAFSLTGKPPNASRGWIVGRSPKADVKLSYDPFVSDEDAEIVPNGNGYRLLDLRSSVNRVRVDNTELECGEEVELERGDLIEVGRSSLLYQGP